MEITHYAKMKTSKALETPWTHEPPPLSLLPFICAVVHVGREAAEALALAMVVVLEAGGVGGGPVPVVVAAAGAGGVRRRFALPAGIEVGPHSGGFFPPQTEALVERPVGLWELRVHVVGCRGGG